MRNTLWRSAHVVAVLLALLMMTAGAAAQNTDDLLNQLRGKAEAPSRNAAQLAQAYQQAIDALLPLMSAEDVGSRYRHQIAFQDMGSHAARPGAEVERQTLAKVIIKNLEQASMPATVRHWFVLQLERIGKGESVPALVKLMADKDAHLRDYARRALEKNPDPSATEALLKELASAKAASWRIGLINALGARGDEAAVAPITAALQDPDLKVAGAAVTALSTIGGIESGRALVGVLNQPFNPMSIKAAEGLLEMGADWARHSKYDDAARIYGFLYEGATQVSLDPNAPNPLNIRAAAIVGLGICNPDSFTRKIPDLMRDDDPKFRAAVVQAARQAPTKAPTQALSRMLPELDAASQVQVLGLIGERSDRSSLEVVTKALEHDQESVRIAAIDALAKLGADTSVDRLLEIAVGGNGATQRAARQGLAAMIGPRVEEVIQTQAASGDTKTRALAIGLLGERHVPNATESLLGYATDENEDISTAAFKALAAVAGPDDIGTLAALLAKAKSEAARKAAAATLKTVLPKASDKDAAAQAISKQMTTSEASAKQSLLTTLNALGGSAALQIVAEAAQSTDEAWREAGMRTLSDWPDYEATETLLGIASKSGTSLTHYVLATRGALRLIKTSDAAPLEGRTALCLYAFDHARRDDEKRQAIATLGALPSKQAADRLLELVKDESLKAEAALAAVELARNLLSTDRRGARQLAQTIRDMDVSGEINRRADRVIAGRRR